MQFQIEVRPRSRANRRFVAYYQIVAPTERAAIAEAMRRFADESKDNEIANYMFRAVKV